LARDLARAEDGGDLGEQGRRLGHRRPGELLVLDRDLQLCRIAAGRWRGRRGGEGGTYCPGQLLAGRGYVARASPSPSPTLLGRNQVGAAELPLAELIEHPAIARDGQRRY